MGHFYLLSLFISMRILPTQLFLLSLPFLFRLPSLPVLYYGSLLVPLSVKIFRRRRLSHLIGWIMRLSCLTNKFKKEPDDFILKNFENLLLFLRESHIKVKYRRNKILTKGAKLRCHYTKSLCICQQVIIRVIT